MSIFGRRVSWASLPVKQSGTVAIGALFASALGLVVATSSASAFTGFQSAFDCGDVIGKVFEDNNGNGIQDRGEQGLPGVRLSSARGLVTTTDKHGRYHVTCAQLPTGSIGSTFVLKVDQRSLPIGHRVATENPRAIRLTAGKVSKLNFGTSASRVVRLDLAGGAFQPNGTDLNPEWDAGIDQLIAVLGEDPSVLRVVYRQGAEGDVLADQRMKAISRLVEQRWKQRDRSYRLEIEGQMMMAGR